MTKRGLGVLALVVAFLLAGTVPPASASSPNAKHDRAVSFWTHDRVARAQPRDFVYDPAARRFVPSERAKGGGGKPGGTSGSTVTGASWTKGGEVLETTGKVLFRMGDGLYVCSASVAGSSAIAGKAVVLTAAHCAFDEVAGAYATEWIFIPQYDSAPAPLSGSSAQFCPQTTWGCWTAATMHVDAVYRDAGGFNSTSIPYDFAFISVAGGGHSGTADLDATVGTQAIAFTTITGSKANAFGYPASGKYNGTDLVYCAGTVGTDPYQSNKTYALGCDMTGGSSGGPWLHALTTSGTGTLSSVNSYGYSGVKNMYGPMLGAAAQTQYTAARSS